MRSCLQQRLARLERQLSCPRHQGALSCPGCDWPTPDEPLTLAEEIHLITLAEHLLPEPSDAATFGPCLRCGGPMVCDACLEAPDPEADRRLEARLAQLSAEERALVTALLGKSGHLF